jgi:hypothetical protein
MTVSLDLTHQSGKGRLDALQIEGIDGVFDDQFDLGIENRVPALRPSALGSNVEVFGRARNAASKR